MNRSEALAPLESGQGRFNVTAGMAVRGQVRRAAIKAGVDFYEEKGFLESVFVFRGDKDRVLRLRNFLKSAIED